jgi:long-chain acyl-CoA synthetase
MAQRPWLESYPTGVPADVTVDIPITRVLERTAEQFPTRVATDFLGAVTTWNALARRVDRASTALLELGVKPGDRVSIVLPNSATHVVLFLAVLRIGAVVAEHNPTYTATGLGQQISDAGSVVALVWEKAVAPVREVADQTDLRTIVAVNLAADLPVIKRLALHIPVAAARKTRASLRSRVPAGTLLWHHLARHAKPLPADHPHPELDDPAVLLYTGGTTGTPKGALLTHRNIAVNAIQGQAWTQHEAGTQTVLGALPFFHAFGMMLALAYSVQIAATLNVVPRFDVDLVLDAHHRRPLTFVPGVPPIFERLATVAIERGEDLTSIQYGISGAMPLPTATAERWEEVTGGLLIEGYGMTETSPVALGNPLSSDRRPGVLGLPFPSTWARVCDPEEPTRVVPNGERGELQISGPQVFAGYWNHENETSEILLEDDGRTWLRTGDVVVEEDGGSFRLVDRIKELIITGGFNVYPSQVEDHLRQMPEIADVAVVGLPGGDLGERVVAAIVLAEGHSRVELATVRTWSENALARYALPRELVVLPDLPRSQLGKVLRRVIREQLQQRDHSATDTDPNTSEDTETGHQDATTSTSK